jgi:hypothetical protein
MHKIMDNYCRVKDCPIRMTIERNGIIGAIEQYSILRDDLCKAIGTLPRINESAIFGVMDAHDLYVRTVDSLEAQKKEWNL